MPIYEYVCDGCSKGFEELIVRRSDEKDVRCPACGSASVLRKISRPAATRSGAGGGGPGNACGPVG